MANYNSTHTGSQIDAAVTRALSGGDIDQDIAKKMDATESTDYPGCYYRMSNNVKEWLNPPMVLGTEYRTTKRYLGKPVYTKVFDAGSIAAGATVVVSMEEDPDNPVISRVVSAHGYAPVNNQYFTPTYVDFIYVRGGGVGTVSLKNAYSVDFSANYVLIEYTKTTD